MISYYLLIGVVVFLIYGREFFLTEYKVYGSWVLIGVFLTIVFWPMLIVAVLCDLIKEWENEDH